MLSPIADATSSFSERELIVIAGLVGTLGGAALSPLVVGWIENSRARRRGRAAVVALVLDVTQAISNVEVLRASGFEDSVFRELIKFEVLRLRFDDLTEALPLDDLGHIARDLRVARSQVQIYDDWTNAKPSERKPFPPPVLDSLHETLTQAHTLLVAQVRLTQPWRSKVRHPHTTFSAWRTLTDARRDEKNRSDAILNAAKDEPPEE